MAYNQMLQNTVDGVKAIIKTDLCIFDTEGRAVASTLADTENFKASVLAFVQSPAEIQMVKDYQYFKIFDSGMLELIMIIQGDRDEVYTIGKLVTLQVKNLISAYKDRYDRENFIKSVLLDNMLLVDIYNKAEKLHIDAEARRVVLLIETANYRDSHAMEILKNYFSDSENDFVTAVDESNLIVVKEMVEDEDYEAVDDLAHALVELLNTEAMTKARVAYGTIVGNIKDISRTYKEARMAMDVGKIFYYEKAVAAYNHLGIGRLIYQLPISLCKVFFEEVFPDMTPEDFDEETLNTIQRFFENSLNVSETARQLYIHRNTLVYRIEKVNKAAGLDLRNFDDAMTFQLAMMVMQYMHFMENKK